MGKTLGFLSILLCLFGICILHPVLGYAETNFALLDVKYEGNFDKVYVFVNNVASGEVAQGKTLTLHLPGNADYQVTLKREERAETKTVYLAKDLRRQLVFYGPNLPE
jgi:hypothetical protein